MAGVLSLKVFTNVRTGFKSLGFLTRALALMLWDMGVSSWLI